MPTVRIPVELANTTWPSSCVNVWHARVTGLEDLNGALAADGGPLGALETFYETLVGYFPGGTQILIPNLVVNVEDQTELEGEPVQPIVGTGTSSAPRGLAAVISWSTSIRARRGRGRTFIGPLQNGLINPSNGGLQEANRAQIEQAANTLVETSKKTNGWALGVYGQETKGVAGTHVLRDFTGAKVPQQFAHLRSRRD